MEVEGGCWDTARVQIVCAPRICMEAVEPQLALSPGKQDLLGMLPLKEEAASAADSPGCWGQLARHQVPSIEAPLVAVGRTSQKYLCLSSAASVWVPRAWGHNAELRRGLLGRSCSRCDVRPGWDTSHTRRAQQRSWALHLLDGSGLDNSLHWLRVYTVLQKILSY